MSIFRKTFDRARSSEIVRPGAWNGLGAAGLRIQLLVATLAIARYSGASEVGIFGMAQGTISLLSVLFGAGLGLAGTKLIAEARASDPSRAITLAKLLQVSGISAGLIAGGLTIIFSRLISSLTFAQSTVRYENIVIICGFVLTVSIFSQVQISILAGREEYKRIGIIYLAQSLILAPVYFWVAHDYGIEGVLVTNAISGAILCFLNGIVIRSGNCSGDTNRTIPTEERGIYIEIVRFGLPVLLSSVVITGSFWTCNRILISGAGGMSELGLLAVAQHWRNALLFVPAVFSQVAVPVLARNAARGGGAGMEVKVLKELAVANALAVGLPTIALILGARLVLKAYGSAFAAGRLIFILLCLAALLQALQSPAIKYLEANGLNWRLLFFNLLQGAILVTTAALLCGQMHGLGIAIAYVLSFLIQGIVCFHFLGRRLRFFSR